ncbi:hypothetical protein ACQB6R_02130 [Propionibacteriaceae bacterium G1746]
MVVQIPRRFMSVFLLWAGRVVLVVVPVSALVCRLLFDGWALALPGRGVATPLSQDVVTLVGALWGMALPWLVFPVGSGALATVQDGVLRVPTALGSRAVVLDGARIGACVVPASRWSILMTSVRRDWQWVVVAESRFYARPAMLQAHLRARVSWWSWAKGVLVLFAAALSALVGGVAMQLLAGASIG